MFQSEPYQIRRAGGLSPELIREQVKTLTVSVSGLTEPDIELEVISTPLGFAAQRGELEIVKLLIGAGVDIHTSDSKGLTPMILATENGHDDIAELLTKDHPTKADRTAFLSASEEGHEGVVEALLAKGVNVDTQSDNSWTALFYTSREGHEGVVRVLLAKGANIDHQSEEGFTALMLASGKGHEGVVEALLAKGANVDIQSEKGTTALMFASEQGHKRVVEALLAKGANVDIQSEIDASIKAVAPISD